MRGKCWRSSRAQDLAAAVTDNQGGLEQAQASYDAAVQKAQQDLATDQAGTRRRRRNSMTAGKALFKQGAVSAKDVDDAGRLDASARHQYETAQKELDLKVAEGQLTAAKGQERGREAQLSYTKIVSPIDGVVTDRPVYPGEMPRPATPILTVMNLSQVVARAHVSQQEAATLKVGDAATISAPGVEPGREGQGDAGEPGAGPEQHDRRGLGAGAQSGRAAEAGRERARDHGGRNGAARHRHSGGGLLTDPDGATSVIMLDTTTSRTSRR